MVHYSPSPLTFWMIADIYGFDLCTDSVTLATVRWLEKKANARRQIFHKTARCSEGLKAVQRVGILGPGRSQFSIQLAIDCGNDRNAGATARDHFTRQLPLEHASWPLDFQTGHGLQSDIKLADSRGQCCAF